MTECDAARIEGAVDSFRENYIKMIPDLYSDVDPDIARDVQLIVEIVVAKVAAIRVYRDDDLVGFLGEAEL